MTIDCNTVENDFFKQVLAPSFVDNSEWDNLSCPHYGLTNILTNEMKLDLSKSAKQQNQNKILVTELTYLA